LSLRPRPEIEKVQAASHGGPVQAELMALGLTPETVLDFSVCSNPYPPPRGVREILATVPINYYPDSEATELRQCLAGALAVPPDNILVGAGVIEIIRLVTLTYIKPGDNILILEPTFGEYRVACQIAGAGIKSLWGREEEQFTPGVEEVVDSIKRYRPIAVFMCNPNNPTGNYLTRQQVEIVLDACADSLLILDEAYINFVEEGWSVFDLVERGNVVILRSMTKDYALAGLRLGYAVAASDIIQVLRKVRPPWNVSTVAQKAGVAALRDTDYLERCKKDINGAKRFLTDGLTALGFYLLPSSTNFFLVKVADSGAFRRALLRRGILVRDCTSFGLPGYVRLAPRTLPECEQLMAAIKALKQEGEIQG